MLKGFSNEKWIIGYDLGWDYAQISYCRADTDKVETISSVAGSENYSIPLVLCKRAGVNQWFYGQEAIRYAQENDGILVEDLLNLALSEEPVVIEETEYQPIALLTLFFKRSLGMLSGISSADKIEAMMITCESLDEKLLDTLNRVVANLRLKTDRVSIQTHQESYYAYMLRQSQELWKEPSVLFDYHGNRMSFYRLECNKRTNPIVVLIHKEQEEFPSRESLSGNPEGDSVLDNTFLEFARERLGAGRVSSVYLIGDDFSEEWMKGSLKYLFEGRRIFLGNNLFSKGACYGMLESFSPSEQAGRYVFLGEDKLKSNIGMKIMRGGEESYLALLDAGNNWMRAKACWEFYLKEENTVELSVTSLNGGGIRTVPIVLEQLSGEMARIRMELHMEAENLLIAQFEDLGFGEFRPAENRHWRQEICLD